MTTSHKPYSSVRTRSARSALTLIEILIALTMTLIVLGAMMTAFQWASVEMQNRRATLEMANRLRLAEERLRLDLESVTVDPRPYTDSTNPNGFWEYVEGPRRDSFQPFTADDSDSDGIRDRAAVDANNNGQIGDGEFTPTSYYPVPVAFDPDAVGNTHNGDIDDMWAATIRARNRPFRGRIITPNGTIGSTSYQTIVHPAGGTAPVSTIESPLAEVVWWTNHNDLDGDYALDLDETVTVYRRQLLIVPPSTVLPIFLSSEAAAEYLAATDISARITTFVDTGTTFYQITPNTTKELAHRGTRFGRQPATGTAASVFPFPIRRSTLFAQRAGEYSRTSGFDLSGTNGVTESVDGVAINYNGSDIMLTDVASFDIKVYSPNAMVASAGGLNVLVEPSDGGFTHGSNRATLGVGAAQQRMKATDLISLGSFVDLGHFGGTVAALTSDATATPAISSLTPGEVWFSGMPLERSQLAYQYLGDLFPTAASRPAVINGLTSLVYDSWTPVYESDGVDQDGSGTVDQATNGVDDGGPASPDDSTELETTPPYPVPVRGIKVSIRLIEKGTKQVHQASIVHSYVPE